MCLVKFNSRGDEQYLLVGIVKDLQLDVNHCNGGAILTYKVLNEGKSLEFVHRTPVEMIPAAICPFQGRVLIGVGSMLRIYEMGKKKLLKKCENKVYIFNIIHFLKMWNFFLF